jgi:hypothetical protein
MSNLLFPDHIIQDDIFIKCSLIYFDDFFSVPIKPISPELSAFAKKINLDVDWNRIRKEEYSIVSIHKSIGRLHNDNIIKSYIDLNLNDQNASAWIDFFIGNILPHCMQNSEITNSALEISFWADDSPNYYEGEAPENSPAKIQMHLLKTFIRIYAARYYGINIITNSLSQLRFLNQIQLMSFGELNITGYYKKELDIIKMSLPFLIAKTINEVMEIKERYKDSLLQFRSKIDVLANNFKFPINEQEYNTEIKNYVDTQVVPEIINLQKDLLGNWDSLKKLLVPSSKEIVSTGIAVIGGLISESWLIPSLLPIANYLADKSIDASKLFAKNKSLLKTNPYAFAVLSNK